MTRDISLAGLRPYSEISGNFQKFENFFCFIQHQNDAQRRFFSAWACSRAEISQYEILTSNSKSAQNLSSNDVNWIEISQFVFAHVFMIGDTFTPTQFWIRQRTCANSKWIVYQYTSFYAKFCADFEFEVKISIFHIAISQF